MVKGPIHSKQLHQIVFFCASFYLSFDVIVAGVGFTRIFVNVQSSSGSEIGSFRRNGSGRPDRPMRAGNRFGFFENPPLI